MTSVISMGLGTAGALRGVGVLGSSKFKTGLSGSDKTRQNGELTLPSSAKESALSFPKISV